MNLKLKKQISMLSEQPGVYVYKDYKKQIIYIGKSVNIKNRVKSYFVNSKLLGPKTSQLVKNIVSVESISTDSEIEALLLESVLVKKHKPYFNIALKDDKNFKYIKILNGKYRNNIGITKVINQDVWPAITTERKITDPNALYFGPFPDGTIVIQVLKIFRQIFPWCKYQSHQEFLRNHKPCFYSHIRLCPGICNNSFTLKQYWDNFDRLIQVLNLKKDNLLSNLYKQMHKASINEEFEKATKIRDMITKIGYILQEFHAPEDYSINPNLRIDIRSEEINSLFNILNIKLNKDINDIRIEGYDISNFGSAYTVASQVTFIGGEPDKTQYRRYKINERELPNDYAAITEVISRRFKLKNQINIPDLILIDGGKGQLQSGLKSLSNRNLYIPMIGLAKKNETIIKLESNHISPISLNQNSPALKLIQRIRDESHRFANKYQRLLHQKQSRLE